MAGSVNKVILLGNLGRDPEIRFAQDGSKIVNLSIATSESWKDKTTGERKDRTEWHRVVIFNDRLADVAERYLKKGSKIYLEGQIQTRKWSDTSGIEKYTTEIILSKYRGELSLLDSRNESAQNVGTLNEPSYDSSRGGTGAYSATELDDEIPF